MIDRLSNGDITKHEEIYKQNYLSCLNLLAAWKARDRYLEHKNKNQTRR